MYKQLFIGVFILSGNFLFSQALQEEHTITEKPNFVLILVDDAALQDFGVYGGEAYTPNIDRLAHQ